MADRMETADVARTSRVAGGAQTVMGVVLALLVATLSLKARQPPPPNIAEFAPAATEQVKEAPPSQSSAFGSEPGGSGEGGEGGTATTTTTVPEDGDVTPTTLLPATEVPKVKRCVGQPPRQIEDPQSPPCVAYWDDSNGNGGATYRGVTANEIRIGVPTSSAGTYNNALQEFLRRFFNKRFQFYGRQITLVPISFPNYENSGQQSAAQDAYQKQVFASLDWREVYEYQKALAAKGIISVARNSDFTDADLARSAPYIWGYPMANNRIQANVAEWACKRLANRPATWAGQRDNASMSDAPRKFAVIFEVFSPDNPLNGQHIVRALEGCSNEKVELIESKGGTRSGSSGEFRETSATEATNHMLRLKGEGVTSIFCFCVPSYTTDLMNAAAVQRFEPEWILTSYPELYTQYWNNALSQAPPGQRSRVFGLTFEPRDVAPEDHPSIWAMHEAGRAPNRDERQGNVAIQMDYLYRGWLVLASGIQMAGPNLTPQTFADGLHRARFPNPRTPLEAGAVGFEDRDYTMTNDGTEVWWDVNASTAYEGNRPGAFCYVDGGKRYKAGEWPTGPPPLFNGPCDSGVEPRSNVR